MNGKNCHHSPRATLAAVGLKLRALGLLAPIEEKVKIAQKKIKHEPLDKLQDALVTILGQAASWRGRDKGWGDVIRFEQSN